MDINKTEINKAILLLFLSLGLFMGWVFVRGCSGINFERECGGYLSRAANANTVELAQANIKTALNYLESNNLTSGYTSILYRTPDEDIGYWYSNLIAAKEELQKITADTSQLEKTNILMKLRETLLDNGEQSSYLVCPSGISVYPYNTLFGFYGWIFGVLTFYFGIIVFFKTTE